VQRTGYAPWTREGIVVRRGEGDCAPIEGVLLQVALEPLSPS
jgi:hypothetical protein